MKKMSIIKCKKLHMQGKVLLRLKRECHENN